MDGERRAGKNLRARECGFSPEESDQSIIFLWVVNKIVVWRVFTTAGRIFPWLSHPNHSPLLLGDEPMAESIEKARCPTAGLLFHFTDTFEVVF
jgi:hypothetical protein